jgi:hypothetical protein
VPDSGEEDRAHHGAPAGKIMMRQKNRLLTEDTGKTCSLGLLLPELTEPWRRPQRHEEKETPRPGKMNRGKMLRSSTSHIESEQHKTRCKNTFFIKEQQDYNGSPEVTALPPLLDYWNENLNSWLTSTIGIQK